MECIDGSNIVPVQASTDSTFASTIAGSEWDHDDVVAVEWPDREYKILLACECDEQRRDECLFDSVEFHDSSTASTARIGHTGQRSHRCCSKPDTHMECIDRSDIVPSAGIDGFNVCINDSRSEWDYDDIVWIEWTVSEHEILLACECDEQWRDECVFHALEFHDSSAASTASGTRVGYTSKRSNRSCDEPHIDMECIDRSDIVPSAGIDGFDVCIDVRGSE